ISIPPPAAEASPPPCCPSAAAARSVPLLKDRRTPNDCNNSLAPPACSSQSACLLRSTHPCPRPDLRRSNRSHAHSPALNAAPAYTAKRVCSNHLSPCTSAEAHPQTQPVPATSQLS